MNKTEIEAKIASIKKSIASPVTPEPMKAKMKEQLEKLQKELESAQEEPAPPAPKPAPVKKDKKAEVKPKKEKAEKPDKKEAKKEPVKPAPEKKEGTLKSIEYRGVTYTAKDKEFCEMVKKAFEKRTADRDKAQKKHKTQSVSTIIAGHLAQAVKRAIDNKSAADIAKRPVLVIENMKRLEKSVESLKNDFKTFLGSDYKAADMDAEFEPLRKMIKDLMKKYEAED